MEKSSKDVKIARRYLSTSSRACTKGQEFTLTFSQYKRLMTRKTCGYTKALLNHDNPESLDYITLDRIDNSKGYVNGNCIAISKRANTLKGNLENPNNNLTLNMLSNFCDTLNKLNLNL